MNISVERVTTAGTKRHFMQLPAAVNAADSFHVPSKEFLPADGCAFVAYLGGKPVARCAARLQTGNPSTGTIGSFEAFNESDAVKALLDSAVQWLKAHHATRIIGPMDGDTWHAYRFTTGPFDAPPFFKEPWNPPYYPSLWEAAGFTVTEHYDTYIVNDPATAASNQQRFYERCLKMGHTFLPVTARGFAGMLPLLHELSCRIFCDNVLYTPIGFDEFRNLYLPARSLFRSGLSWIALAPDGTPEGYIFTFPDYADAIRAMRGETHLAAKMRFAMHRSRATRTCIKTLGTIPERRRSGVSAALTHLAYRGSAALGYRQTLMCLMHSANDSRRFGGDADCPYRAYALYEYVS